MSGGRGHGRAVAHRFNTELSTFVVALLPTSGRRDVKQQRQQQPGNRPESRETAAVRGQFPEDQGKNSKTNTEDFFNGCDTDSLLQRDAHSCFKYDVTRQVGITHVATTTVSKCHRLPLA